ncbi:glycoside hydrolase family protein [Glycocaulis sp.]|uniref:glycoside hydrolase family protein n=1 Tax=Glycocaulis sp. TaxID=1969725 RepID=UPI003D23F534
MKPRLKSSRAARELIKTHEPFLGDALRRGRRWALGYGHTAAAKEGARISREDAELLLLYDVIQAEQAIDKAVGEDLPGSVRDALVSFACSIGPGAFKVSDVARLARDGRHLEAAAALETWVRAEEDGRLVVSERLVRRRAAEKALYLKGLQEKAEPAPAPAAPPQPEAEAADPAPRIGPLVDLELEFIDPPEPGGMVLEDDTPEPEAVEEPLAEPQAEPEPEAATEPAPAEEETPSPAPALAPDELDDPTGSVIARMNAQMAETMAVPADAPAREETPVASDARLGFSFMQRAEPEAPAPAPQPAAEPEQPRYKVGPVPVYAAISSVTITRTDIAVPVTPPVTPPAPEAVQPTAISADSPAPSAGFSGEVQAVGRPADMPEEDEAVDSDEIHPGVLMGTAAPAPELPQAGPGPAAPAKAPGNGTWLFVANLAVGVAMTGFGLWTIIERGTDPEIVDFGLLGPVAAAMGIALTITSAWILLTRTRQPKAAAESADTANEASPPEGE